ncbi:hypothetical protein JHW43_003753 [Diplocarpon mali]|nr:hypothetical protein JHW43_003753 [Diplocarpon mali]
MAGDQESRLAAGKKKIPIVQEVGPQYSDLCPGLPRARSRFGLEVNRPSSVDQYSALRNHSPKILGPRLMGILSRLSTNPFVQARAITATSYPSSPSEYNSKTANTIPTFVIEEQHVTRRQSGISSTAAQDQRRIWVQTASKARRMKADERCRDWLQTDSDRRQLEYRNSPRTALAYQRKGLEPLDSL